MSCNIREHINIYRKLDDYDFIHLIDIMTLISHRNRKNKRLRVVHVMRTFLIILIQINYFVFKIVSIPVGTFLNFSNSIFHSKEITNLKSLRLVTTRRGSAFSMLAR